MCPHEVGRPQQMPRPQCGITKCVQHCGGHRCLGTVVVEASLVHGAIEADLGCDASVDDKSDRARLCRSQNTYSASPRFFQASSRHHDSAGGDQCLKMSAHNQSLPLTPKAGLPTHCSSKKPCTISTLLYPPENTLAASKST